VDPTIPEKIKTLPSTKLLKRVAYTLISPHSKLNSPAASKLMLPSTIKRPNKKKSILTVATKIL